MYTWKTFYLWLKPTIKTISYLYVISVSPLCRRVFTKKYEYEKEGKPANLVEKIALLNKRGAREWKLLHLGIDTNYFIFERKIENLSVGRSLREEIQNATGRTEYGGSD